MKNSIEKFRNQFPDSHSLIVALHSQSLEHALEGAEIAIKNGAHGVALVTHVISPSSGLAFAMRIKETFPYNKVLLNVLQRDPYNFRDRNMQRGPRRVMESVNYTDIDGIWADKAMIKGIDRTANVDKYEDYADETLQWQQENGRDKLYFGGFDFKGQTSLTAEEYPFAVQQAKKYLDVITTSGAGTGISADSEKVKKIKELAGDYPLGLASGVTAQNIGEYIGNTDISIVASGISKDYYNLDPDKVLELADIIYAYNKKMARKKFEAETLKKYNVETVAELDSYIKKHDIINIGGRPESPEIERQLSNLYPSPFTLDGVEYASIEAFRMYIKNPDTDREHIKGLDGIQAKRAGNDVKFKRSFVYQGKEIVIGSQQHHDLLQRALRAKLEQNPDILKALLNTGNRELIHIVFTKDRKFLLADSKTIPGEKFAQMYRELRDEFRNK